MPFTKESAKLAGLKGGPNRWKDKDPATVRNRLFSIKLSNAEMDILTEKADALGISKTELIISAVKAYKKKRNP